MSFEREKRRAKRCPVDWKIIPPGEGYSTWLDGTFCGPACYAIYRKKIWGRYVFLNPSMLMDHINGKIKRRRERRRQSKTMRNMRKGGGKAR